VVKGLHGPGHAFDYRRAPSAKGPWRVKRDVVTEDQTGPVWEFPVYSVMGRRLNQLTPQRLRAKFSRNAPKDRRNEMMGELGVRPGNPFALLKFMWQPVPIKLDYHNLSTAALMRMIRSAPKPANGAPDVLMLIGHTKEHVDDGRFDQLLGAIGREPGLKVVTLDHLAGLVEAGLPQGEKLERKP
jgi:hypothetical protein